MSFGRLHTLVTYLMAGVGLFALSLGGELSPGALALLFLGYALSLPIGPRLWARPAYTSFWNGAVLAVLGLQLVRGFTGAPILPLLLEYAGFLQLAKLFHRRTAKDHHGPTRPDVEKRGARRAGRKCGGCARSGDEMA